MGKHWAIGSLMKSLREKVQSNHHRDEIAHRQNDTLGQATGDYTHLLLRHRKEECACVRLRAVLAEDTAQECKWVSGTGVIWQAYRKWLPPMRVSRQVPTPELP